MRVRVPPPPPDNAPRPMEDTQPFDLRRVKRPSIAPAAPVAPVAPVARGSATRSVAPHLPPGRADVVVGALPSVMVDDTPNRDSALISLRRRRRP